MSFEDFLVSNSNTIVIAFELVYLAFLIWFFSVTLRLYKKVKKAISDDYDIKIIISKKSSPKHLNRGENLLEDKKGAKE